MKDTVCGLGGDYVQIESLAIFLAFLPLTVQKDKKRQRTVNYNKKLNLQKTLFAETLLRISFTVKLENLA